MIEALINRASFFMFVPKLFSILLLNIILISVCLAQINFPNAGRPHIQNFTVEDYNGFVQSWGFSQDDNGLIYIANQLSVLQYKGTKWNTISITNNRAISTTSHSEVIYVGGNDEFGYLINSSSETSASAEFFSLRGLISDSVSIGSIWEVIGRGNKVYFRSDNYLIAYNIEDLSVEYWQPEIRFSYLFELDNKLYVRSAIDGVFEVDSLGLIRTDWGEKFAENPIIAALNTDEISILCDLEACFSLQDGKLSDFIFESMDYLLEHDIDEGIGLTDGTILFATWSGGIVHYDKNGNLIQIIDESNGLVNNTVYGLFEDKLGAVWVATINGISKLNLHLPFQIYDNSAGIESFINDIIEFDGRLYVANTSTGIYSMDKDSATFSLIKTGSGCAELSILVKNLYTICDGLLYRIDDINLTEIDLSGLTLSVIELYKEPDIIFIGNNLNQTIARINKDEIEVLATVDAVEEDINSIIIDQEQNIWLGTTANGLIKLRVDITIDGNVITSKETYFSDLENRGSSKRVYVTSINSEPAFLTWGAGIQRYDKIKKVMYQDLAFGELLSDTSRQYFIADESKNGSVFIRSGGEFQFAEKIGEDEYHVKSDVLDFIEDGQFTTMYSDSREILWLGVDESLIRYDRNQQFKLDQNFHVSIDEVLVNADSLINGGSNKEFDVIKYDNNEIRFTFSAASLDAPERTEFRVKLDGMEEEWGRWSTESTKDYTNIREGDYEFIVEARDVYGIINSSEPFSFSVLPPWYRTWWAYLLYLIGFSGLAYSSHRIRVNQLLKVERMRTKIASDLHDEVSATLTGITYFAEAVKTDPDQQKKTHFVNLISESAGDAKEKITDIVWSITPENDDWELFLTKCRRYASDLLESKDLNYELKIAESIPGKLNMNTRQHLWMIFKETLTNAVRHSGATRLDVIMDVEEGVFKMIIQDNGEGFDISSKKFGNGLNNIRKRAEHIKAHLELDSETGMGTRWRLELKL